jgi:endo-1,4-beta-xylanase
MSNVACTHLWAAAAVAVCCLGWAGCSTVDEPSEESDSDVTVTLRSLAETRSFQIGAAADAAPATGDARYIDRLSGEFNSLTPGNELKFGPLRPTRQTYSWGDADRLVAFAESNSMRVRGHTLLWHQQNPHWLSSGNYNRDQLLAILEDHVKTVVGRYKGRIAAWDVLNEAIDDDGSLRETLWLEGIGPEYIDLAFQWAHEADPEALLFYNDYSAEGLGTKSDAVYDLVVDLKSNGVPIDGVGMQMHFSTEWSPPTADVAANVQRLANAGLLVQITEMDVRIPMPARQVELRAQAELYRSMLQICLDAPNCFSFTIWGVSDANSWRPGHFEGYGAGLIFDEDYEPKPAYFTVRDALAGKD